MDGSGGVENLTTLDVYADATKFKGDVEADGDLIGERLILTQNTKTYFRGGSDGIPEYSRNGSTYYDFITTENHKQDVDSVNLIVTGGASGTATHTIVPNSSYTINISGLNASYLNSGTIPGARMSSNGSIYSHVTVGKAGYATQAQKANVASQLNGLSSTSGTLATQAWVTSAIQSNGSVPDMTTITALPLVKIGRYQGSTSYYSYDLYGYKITSDGWVLPKYSSNYTIGGAYRSGISLNEGDAYDVKQKSTSYTFTIFDPVRHPGKNWTFTQHFYGGTGYSWESGGSNYPLSYFPVKKGQYIYLGQNSTSGGSSLYFFH